MRDLILVINPGSTSTKISVYQDDKEVFTKTLRHTNEELAPFACVKDQKNFRTAEVKKALLENDIKLDELAIIVGRGGLLRPIPSGVYGVNDAMLKDVESCIYGEHASNLGAMVADELVKEINSSYSKSVKAIIADPVVVDELEPIARISGQPSLNRKSIFHALNQKAIAKRYAKEQGKEYKDMNLVIAHLGGGVSVGIHKNGKVVDVNDALNGDGPFTPERSGSLAARPLADLCFSGKYTQQEINKMISGKGGIVAHLGTNSFAEVEKRVLAGDEKAMLISDAFAYNLAKQIGAMATVVDGKVDAILVTGGIAYNTPLMEKLKQKVQFIAPVTIYPGEDEMGALAQNGLAVLRGAEEVKTY